MSKDGNTGGNGLMNRDGGGRKGSPTQGGTQGGSGADKAQAVADRMQPKPGK